MNIFNQSWRPAARPTTRRGSDQVSSHQTQILTGDGAQPQALPPINWNAPRIAAELVYDTATAGLPTGIRAAIQEGSRRLMIEADEYEVLLRVAPNRYNGEIEIVGQVLFEGLPLAAVPISLGAAPGRIVGLTDQGGGFRLPSLISGPYELRLAVADGIVELPPLDLSPTSSIS